MFFPLPVMKEMIVKYMTCMFNSFLRKYAQHLEKYPSRV